MAYDRVAPMMPGGRDPYGGGGRSRSVSTSGASGSYDGGGGGDPRFVPMPMRRGGGFSERGRERRW